MDTLLVLNQLLKKDAEVIQNVLPILHASTESAVILAAVVMVPYVKLSIIDQFADAHLAMKEIQISAAYSLDATAIKNVRLMKNVTRGNVSKYVS